jgi:aldose sugar dehydrogenase
MVATGRSTAPTPRLILERMNEPGSAPPTRKVPTLARALGWSAACFVALVAGSIAACSESSRASVTPVAPPAGDGAARATVPGAALTSPWGLAFLPDGRMLISPNGGSMAIVRADGTAIDATMSGVPAVNSQGQGGLLDVALDPDFATDAWVYFTFSEGGADGTGTALARGRLVGNALPNVAVIWRQTPKVNSDVHYGSRIVLRSDEALYLSVGERGQADPVAPTASHAQNLAKTLGKALRLNGDGSVPLDNRSFNLPRALPAAHSGAS